MPTNHWQFSSFDNLAWTVGTTFPQRDIVIPAGGTMKRFLVRQTRMQASATGVGIAAVGNFYLVQSIDIVAGAYLGRNLFAQKVAIPCQFTTLFDPLSGGRIFSALWNGADNEFEINQRCSFGLRGGPGFTVRYSSSVFEAGGFSGLLLFPRASVEFRTLHETVP